MDASYASLAKPAVFLCNGSFQCRYSTFSTQSGVKPAKKLMDNSVPSLKISPWGSFPTRRRTNLPVYSQFRRPPRRRNSLREKIIPRQDQVLLFPEISNSESNFEDLGVIDHEKQPEEAVDSKKFNSSRNSALWDKLDDWVGKYKEDSEFWGIGAGPIFTIFQSSDGDIIRASVNEDEILKRNRIRTWSSEGRVESKEIKDVNSKISIARIIAKEIEVGAYKMPRNSSIARFVVEGKKSSLIGLFHAFSSQRGSLVRIFPRVGFTLLCFFCVLGAVTKLFVGYNDVELTREEAEMLRRKKKARMEREELKRGSVEVLKNGAELPVIYGTMPQLNRDELMKNIMDAKKSRGRLVLSDTSAHFPPEKHDFNEKVREIRNMVRKVREVECKKQSSNNHTGQQDELSSIIDDDEFQTGDVENHALHEAQSAKVSVQRDNFTEICSHSSQEDNNVTSKDVKEMNTLAEEMDTSLGDFLRGEPSNSFDTGRSNDVVIVEDQETKALKNFQKLPVGTHKTDPGAPDIEMKKVDSNSARGEKIIKGSSITYTNKKSKAKIITSVKEAKEYLSTKHKSSVEGEDIIKNYAGFQYGESNGGTQKVFTVDGAADSFDHQMEQNAGIINPSNDCITSGRKNHNATFQHNQNQRLSDHTSPNKEAAKLIVIQSDNSSSNSTQEFNILQGGQIDHVVVGRSENVNMVCDAMTNETKVKKDLPVSNFLRLSESAVSVDSQSSLEKDEGDDDVSHSSSLKNSVSGHFDPVAVNVSSDVSKAEDALNDLSSGINIPSNYGNSNCDNENLPQISGKNWTEENFEQFDSVIKKIGHGFKDNYMLARTKAPENTFSSVDISKLSLWGEDEELEWMKDENLREIVFKVRENELAGRDPFHLMEADDQKTFFQGLERKAEKANEKLAGVHEWIHSRIENLDYGADGISLDDPLEKIIPRWKGPPIEQDPEFLKKFANIGILDDILRDKQENLEKSQNLANSDGVPAYSPVNDRVILSQNRTSTASRTVVECSDGSSRPGKKNSKEHWQHTKKWSQGFLEVYNAETDPEVKSVLKDMGKDLDRWMTEKDRKNVTDLLTKIPKKKRRFIEKKMNKLKREVEVYGAQAVVSKYKEYADEKEEDYLWWLDLQFVLCIELYSVEDDVPRVGFYSLEMAEELELNPKQFHVIAFEDPGDSKNFCHIVQAQMDTLGSGKAFVVARPPKDAFREAKANGFSVTMIKKGEVKLNVDQTLEEVEEELKEVGSKIYHDKIMKERGVDIRSLMKGVMAVK